jgi:hypothetical protein
MLFILQFPFADMRDIQAYDTGKLSTPLWPIPQPDYNFIRSFGIVRERKQGGLTGWVGENIICQADRAIRFTRFSPIADPWTPKTYPIKVIFRRFYSDGSILGKFEIGLRIGLKGDSFSGRLLDDVICQILKLDVTIPNPLGEPKNCKLWQSGKYLSNLYGMATTKTKYLEKTQPFLSIVKPCRPLLILVHDGEVKQIPFDGKVIPSTFHRKTALSFHNYAHEGIFLPLWVIRNEPLEEARKLRIYLSRLHSERECLKAVLSSIANGNVEVNNREKSDILQNYINTATRRVIQLQSKSLSIDERIGLIADEVMDYAAPGEKQAILTTLTNLSVRLNILHKVKDFVSELSETDRQNLSYQYPEVDGIVDLDLKNNLERALRNINLDSVDLGLFDLARTLENQIKSFLEKKIGQEDGKFTHKDLKNLAAMIDAVEREGIVTHSRELHFLREKRNERAHGVIPDVSEREKMYRHAPFLVDLYIKYIIFFLAL